jgi:hypothetical protein
MSLKVLQIVPRLPPTITGVGDYAYLLAEELKTAHNIQTQFLVCDPAWERSSDLDGFDIERLDSRSGGELHERLSASGKSSIVLLHYVGYGYEKRGCPIWIEKGLKQWKEKSLTRRLVVMFHELYASGPVWRSSFWTSYIQRGVASRLASIADSCITNMQRYAQWLMSKEEKHKGCISAMPVFSTVGEEQANLPLSKRSRRMIIFGGAVWVKEVLSRYLEETLVCCRTLGIEEIQTIGSPKGTTPTNLPISICERGFLTAREVIEIISTSRVGVMNYFPGYLAKSSVYAAYTAHGILPVLPRYNPSESDGCEAGTTYLLLDQIKSSLSEESLQRIADNARGWYRAHNLIQTANIYARLIGECAEVC